MSYWLTKWLCLHYFLFHFFQDVLKLLLVLSDNFIYVSLWLFDGYILITILAAYHWLCLWWSLCLGNLLIWKWRVINLKCVYFLEGGVSSVLSSLIFRLSLHYLELFGSFLYWLLASMWCLRLCYRWPLIASLLWCRVLIFLMLFFSEVRFLFWNLLLNLLKFILILLFLLSIVIFK